MKAAKRNIVEGLDHIGNFYKALPDIARMIEAEYDENDLRKAYEDFLSLPDPEEPINEEHDGNGVWWTNWVLQGKELRFVICFEKYEMTYGWHIQCPDEGTYLKLQVFLSGLLR